MPSTIKKGVVYIMDGSQGHASHVNGKKVTAMENGGTGFMQADKLEVRCSVCDKPFKTSPRSLR